MLYLLAGPFVALIGIVAVFFVMRRKSTEQRSMYSARRQQIEHKVRAARQRTLAPHGHAEKAPAPEAAASPFDQPQVQPTINYPVPSYDARPAAPPAPPAPPPRAAPPSEPQWETPAQPPQQMPWEQPSTPPPAAEPAPSFDYPPAPPEPFEPAPEPAPRAEPSGPVWTPAPRPSEPAAPIEQPVAASATAAGAWSIVTTTKETAETAGSGKAARRDPGASWQLASGEAPGLETEEPETKRPSGTVVAVAQYAVLVVGLVMVLIGVLVMVANSHVT